MRPILQADRIAAVIFDWAGTLIDFGSCAPALAFTELFRQHGVALSVAEARVPMGMEKRAHIARLLQTPDIARRWSEKHGPVKEETIDRLYVQFVPIQLETIRSRDRLVPHALEAQKWLREQNIRIATTTGYNREMAALVTAAARAQGFHPEAVVTANDVARGRPEPWMALRAAERLGVFPPSAVVKIGDTIADIHEGLHAGMWSIGVAATGNELGLTEEEFRSLPAPEREQRLEVARERLQDAGAHLVLDTLAEVPQAISQIEKSLKLRL